MKNKMKLLLIAIGLIILVPFNVSAASCSVDTVFTVDKTAHQTSTGIFYSAGEYVQNIYNTRDEAGNYYQTYCLEAGKYAPHGNTYKCKEEFDLSTPNNADTRGYYASMIKAYELAMKEGYANDKHVMQATFRFITYEYKKARTAEVEHTVNTAFVNWKTSFYGGNATGTARLEAARSIANRALEVGALAKNGMSYIDLVNGGHIWGDKWATTVEAREYTTVANRVQYRVFINPEFDTTGAEIDYTQFKFSTTNTTATVVSYNKATSFQTEPGLPAYAYAYDVIIDISKWDGNPLGLTMKSYLYSPLSGQTNMMLLQSTTSTSLQNMLIVTYGTPLKIKKNNTTTTYGGGSDHSINLDASCVLENGKYYYIKYKNGSQTSKTEVTDVNEMNRLGCPIACTIYDKKYICSDGKVCTNEEYKKQCDVEVPDNCDSLDPNSEEYIRECTDACDPYITIPARCTEFNSQDKITDDITGTVGDINKVKNEVKACVVSSKTTEETITGTTETKTSEFENYCGNWSMVYYYDNSDGETTKGYAQATTGYINSAGAYKCCAKTKVVNGNTVCFDSLTWDERLTYSSLIGYTEMSKTSSGSTNNITTTVITTDKKDAAGNPFLMDDGQLDSVQNKYSGELNPYCKVSCKEDYSFELPGAKYTESGGYFTLSTSVTGTRDCYTSEIDSKLFDEDLEEARKKVIDAYNEYLKWKTGVEDSFKYKPDNDKCYIEDCPPIDPLTGTSGPCSVVCDVEDSVTIVYKEWSWIPFNYNGGTNSSLSATESDGWVNCYDCGCNKKEGSETDLQNSLRSKMNSAKSALDNAIAEFNAIVKDYNNCTNGWDNNMNYDPTIVFDYEEYQNTNYDDTMVQVGSTDVSDDNMYCSGDTNNHYECQSGKTSSARNTTITKFTCDANGCRNTNYTVSTAKWVRKSVTSSGEFEPKKQFSTYTPYGTIALDKTDNTYKLYTSLPAGSLPIELGSITGVYNFKFTISDIGQFNHNDEPGRLIGNSNSVYQAASVDHTAQAGYVCQYILNCDGPDCDYSCVGDNCSFDDDDKICEGPDCTYTCINCIFDGKTSTLVFRPFSLNNVFSNPDRTIGSNWSSVKGKTTKTVIESSGEETYTTPEYSYKLTTANQNAIRKYNKQAGSYSNSLVPTTNESALSEVVISSKYKNIAFESWFLNNGDGTYFEEITRNKEWTLWETYCKANNLSCPIGKSSNTGPSWK